MLPTMSRPAFGVGPTGRLVIAGSARKTVALQLEPAGARLVLASHTDVFLPWDDYGSIGGSWMDPPVTDGSSWHSLRGERRRG